MLDHLYAQAVGARRRWFERHPQARRRLRQPVVSVGNLSVGGTGKTPLVLQIAQWLVEQGERPAILSRGYGRRDRRDGVVVVADGARVRADVDQAGDEPLMLARAVPQAIVAVSTDRYLAGLLAERRLGATVHLLDDGFQHVQLARDFDILMTTPGEIVSGRTLPFGRLREGPAAAARADLVVVVAADLDGARSEAWTLGISQFCAAQRRLIGAGGAEGARSAGGAEGAGGTGGAEGVVGAWVPAPGAGSDHAKAKPASAVIAVAGIAHPEQFFTMLREAGQRVAQTIAFPDHHRYTAADIARIGQVARTADTNVVVTTWKDHIRFETLAPLPFTCTAIGMTLEIDTWDTLTCGIAAALERARRSPRGPLSPAPIATSAPSSTSAPIGTPAPKSSATPRHSNAAPPHPGGGQS